VFQQLSNIKKTTIFFASIKNNAALALRTQGGNYLDRPNAIVQQYSTVTVSLPFPTRKKKIRRSFKKVILTFLLLLKLDSNLR